MVVRFPAAYDMAPLTTTFTTLAADVERYLQRRLPRPLTVTVNNEAGTGTVRRNGKTVTVFTFAPLGGAA
ncbi:hypothetical protein [Streptomyces sp. NPDC058268]|uniref:hypothetical protein n=1 Tax=Streptomyces sp. NPDC058268 TaxID=3346413 RepID=UPI0036EEBC66